MYGYRLQKIDFGQDFRVLWIGKVFYINLLVLTEHICCSGVPRGGGGTPTNELDRYHHMSPLIAMAFEGLHP